MKYKADFVALLIREGLLDLRTAASRRWFNDAIREGWEHAEKYGDVRLLQLIADAYEDRGQRATFIRKLRSHLPIGPSQKSASRLGMDREALASWRRPQTWPDFASSGLFNVTNSHAIQIDATELTATELVSLLVDHLVLNRNSMSVAQLDELMEMLRSIRSRIASANEHETFTDPESQNHSAGEPE